MAGGRPIWDADWDGAMEERSDEGRAGSGRGLLLPGLFCSEGTEGRSGVDGML